MGTYSIATSIPGMTVSHSNYNLLGILYSEVFIYNKFNNDTMQRNAALSSVRYIVPTLFLVSLTDYRISLINKGSQFVQVDIYY